MAGPIIEIGKYNNLEVLKETSFGIYIGDDVEEILMPTKWVPEGTKIGDTIEAFIYTDSEDRLIATTIPPKIQVGEFAYLKAKQVSRFGAFLDWGLDKDLLVPFKEQSKKMEEGQSYLVYLYLDEVTDRLVASSQHNKFLKHDSSELSVGQEVNLLIYEEVELGYYAIVDNTYKGLIYKNEVFHPVELGTSTLGYIKAVREDQKIDLSLQKIGVESIEPNAQKILDKLTQGGGMLPLHDKSNPDEIYKVLGMSKKNFKKAIGALYKKRLVRIGNKGVELINKEA